MRAHNAQDEALQAWVKANVAGVVAGRPAHVHVDELVRKARMSKERWLALIRTVYPRALDLLGGKAKKVMAIGMIPLWDSGDLNTQIPQLSDLAKHMSGEPPSVYLVHRDTFKMMVVGETYRCALPRYGLWKPTLDGVSIVYACSRSEEERRNGWEYRRSIRVEHYDDSHRGQR